MTLAKTSTHPDVACSGQALRRKPRRCLLSSRIGHFTVPVCVLLLLLLLLLLLPGLAWLGLARLMIFAQSQECKSNGSSTVMLATLYKPTKGLHDRLRLQHPD